MTAEEIPQPLPEPGPQQIHAELLTPEQAAALPTAAQEIGVVDGSFNVLAPDGTMQTGWRVEDALNRVEKDGSKTPVVVIERRVENETGDGTVTERRTIHRDEFFSWQKTEADTVGESAEGKDAQPETSETLTLAPAAAESIATLSTETVGTVSETIHEGMTRFTAALSTVETDGEQRMEGVLNNLMHTARDVEDPYQMVSGLIAHADPRTFGAEQQQRVLYHLSQLRDRVDSYGRTIQQAGMVHTETLAGRQEVAGHLNAFTEQVSAEVRQFEAKAESMTKANAKIEGEDTASGQNAADQEAQHIETTAKNRLTLHAAEDMMHNLSSRMNTFVHREDAVGQLISEFVSPGRLHQVVDDVAMTLRHGQWEPHTVLPRLVEIEQAMETVRSFVRRYDSYADMNRQEAMMLARGALDIDEEVQRMAA